MGQQQLLLIILGVIIVGIAIAVGITMFSAQSISANKDAIISDLNNLSADGYQFRIRPVSMGGGGNTYVGYSIKGAWSNNVNATYSIVEQTADTLVLKGASKQDVLNTVQLGVGKNGIISAAAFGGAFQ